MTVLALLEGSVTALSAPYPTQNDLEEAETHQREMLALTESPSFDSNAYRRLNGHSHRVPCLRRSNERMQSLMTNEAERVNRIRRTSFKFTADRSRHSVDQHEHLLNLIRTGASAEEIELYAREHTMTSLNEALLASDV